MYAALAVLVVAGSLIPLSILTGVHFVTFNTGEQMREVGYLSAFNWWVVDGILLPSFTLVLFAFPRAVRQLLRRLSRQGMIVTDRGEPATEANLQASWDKMLVRVSVVSTILGLCIFAIVLREWYHLVFVPIYILGDTETMQSVLGQPPDWSTAALFADGVTPLGNACFSLLAYGVQGLAILLLSHVALFSLAFGLFLESCSRANAQIKIIPNPNAFDGQMGLQAFGSIINYLILWAFAAFGTIALVRFWQQYLRSEFASGAQFLRHEFLHEFWPATLNDVPTSLVGVLYLGAPESYIQTGAMVLGMLAGIVSIGYALIMIQRTVARGRRFMIRHLRNQSMNHRNESREMLQRDLLALQRLSTWPVHQPTRPQIGAMLLFILLAILYYRLVFILTLIAVIVILRLVVDFITDYLSGRES